MMAPRSFLFTRQGPTSAPTAQTSTGRYKNEASSPPKVKSDSPPRVTRCDTIPIVAPIAKSSPPAASEPVVIPLRGHRESSKDSRRSDRNDSRGEKRPSSRSKNRPRDAHSPGAIPPAVAALLALTTIPPPKKNASRRNVHSNQRLTVDAILQHTKGPENEFSLSLAKSPLDFLLSPPESDSEDTASSDPGMESYLSTRTISSDSITSLDAVSIADSGISLPSFMSPDSRGRRSLPRRKLQALSSPPREMVSEHPLQKSEDIDVSELDFRVFETKSVEKSAEEGLTEQAAPRQKSAFKSNLTASLKALRDAARSLSNIKPPYITPDDFLTRSIVALDPSVPFTDERMPPRLEDIPTPALRRYLNPTTNAPIEAHVPSSLSQASRATSSTQITASIQMQTYRITKPQKSSSTSVISRRTSATPATAEEVFAEVAAGPVAKQRDMRENSDFIRVAVMEMLMRRHGKLDEKMPGRARWALPPRQVSTKAYEIGEGGVPARWIAIPA